MGYELEKLFNDNDTQFWTTGKNCSPGWCAITCIFCNDTTNHLGVNVAHGNYSCWKCGAKGSLADLLQELYNIDFVEAKLLVKQYRTDADPKPKPFKKQPKEFHNIIPKEATKEFPDTHKQYLIGRRFNPQYLQGKYHLYACHMFGNYKWRIIAPTIFDSAIVNFVAISVADATLKVKNCPNEKALIDRSNLLYNYDSITNRSALVVEGITDVWRMGDGCVATLSTNFTTAQINLLVKACDEVFIMFDSEAKDRNAPKQALSLANQLTGLVKNVEILSLKDGDPADLTDEEALRIRKEINL